MNLPYHIKLLFFCSVNILFNCSSDNERSLNNSNHTIEIDRIITLGGTKNESGQSIVSTSDGGFAVLGYSQSMDGDILNKSDTSYDYWLLKFDGNGNQEWQKVYGGSNDDKGQDLIISDDGGFLIFGSSKSNDGDVSYNSGSNDFWISKLSNSGEISWEKSFGYSGSDNGYSIIQTNDNGYLISGVLDVSASDGEGNSRMSSSRHAGAR